MKKSGGAGTVLVVLGVIFGVGLLAVVCCVGGLFGLGYYGKQRAEERSQELYAQYDQEIAAAEERNAAMRGGVPGGRASGQNASSAVSVPHNPAPQNIDEALVSLKSSDQQEQQQGIDWLNWHKDEAAGSPQRETIAGELDKLVDNLALREKTLDALIHWATSTNVPKLQAIADTNFGPHVKAKAALAGTKDERAIPQIVALLGEFGHTDAAREALEAIGPAAQSEVIERFNDKDHGVREAARGLLRGYRAKNEAIVAQCALDVASTEAEQRKGAAEWLANFESAGGKIDEVDEQQRKEVSEALEKMLVEETWNRDIAAKALGLWATKDSVPGLVRLLDHSDGRLSELALNVLVDLKEPSAVKPIAAGLADFFKRGRTADALRKMGPVAESAVIPYLRDSDSWTRSEACKILKDIGGPESMDALIVTVQTDRDRGVVDEAKRTLIVLASVELPPRKWSDASGKFNIEASFQDLKDGKVILKKKDGSFVSPSLTTLCEADRQYVQAAKKRLRFINGD